MNGESSAWFIAYDIRPGKQIERRIVLETLALAQSAGANVRELPFIGMGGFRFIDFLLANKFLGIHRFVSLEHDESIQDRCEFNRPFDAIEVFRGHSCAYVDEIGFREPSVVWLDYENAISSDLRDDMLTIGGALPVGSFLFVTATAELPGPLRRVNGIAKRLQMLLPQIEPFGATLVPEDMNSHRFHRAAIGILRAALEYGFAGRADGVFLPYLRVLYKDSTWMMTVGGYFGPAESAKALRNVVKAGCPFLKPNDKEFAFSIEQYNVTDAERRLLDRTAISRTGRRSERAELRRLGLRDEMIKQYAQIMRFVPRYYEALL